MTKTLLNGVNEVLKRGGIIAGDTQAISTLTVSAIQRHIDSAVQVINEGVDELYSQSHIPLPLQQAQSTITLVTGTRDGITLATDLVRLRWPFIDKTNNQLLIEQPGGYNAMLINDPEQDDTGLPHYAAINPKDGKLALDRAPTSVENGRIYTYQYDKTLELDAAADTFPFSDDAFRAMVPAWVQLWKRETRNEFDQPLFNGNIGRAMRFVTKSLQRDHYSPRG